MHFEFSISKKFLNMEKIPLQIGLLLFFISIIIFSQNGQEIKDIIIRAAIICIAAVVLTQLTILFIAKSISNSNHSSGFTRDNKTSKETSEGN